MIWPTKHSAWSVNPFYMDMNCASPVLKHGSRSLLWVQVWWDSPMVISQISNGRLKYYFPLRLMLSESEREKNESVPKKGGTHWKRTEQLVKKWLRACLSVCFRSFCLFVLYSLSVQKRKESVIGLWYTIAWATETKPYCVHWTIWFWVEAFTVGPERWWTILCHSKVMGNCDGRWCYIANVQIARSNRA